jgi:RimJ/RimL family protein N-acetyltransferase
VSKLIEFSTNRLRLRQWRDDDREPFARLNGDARVMEFYPSVLDRAASDAMIDRVQALIADRGWGLWAVEIETTQEFIGYVGLHIPKPDLPCYPCVEVGWRLAFDYWGKGYATEAAQGALRVGFELIDLDEIVSFTAVGNLRSRAVMERLNMKKAADTFLHPSLPPQHRLAEHYLYRLSRKAWADSRNVSAPKA